MVHVVTESLRGQVTSPWLELVLVGAAAVCGGIVGTERERQDKPAGLRTLMLVCLGSAVFTMVSYAFTTTTGDSGRVAAQIVTGIGCLGAGAILHGRTMVSGMTTAAAIWMIAAIGITVGVGLPVAGLGLAVLVRVILVGVRRWEIRHLGGMKSMLVDILFDPDHGKTRLKLECIREEFHVNTQAISYELADEGSTRARLDLYMTRRHLHEFLDEIANVKAVRELREVPRANER